METNITKVIVNRGKELRAMFYRSLRRKVIYFYEWSDLSRCPLVFNTTSSFFHFCKDSNISYSVESLCLLEGDVIFASCAHGCNLLVFADSYSLLREKMNK